MRTRGFLTLTLILIVAALLRTLIGPASSDDGLRLAFSIPSGEILWLRSMSVTSAAVVGATLGLSGLALQTLLRNPLASPFVLGISSGAGFGVACVLVVGYVLRTSGDTSGDTSGGTSGESGALPWATETIGAVVGGSVALAIVSRFGRMGDSHNPTTLVLAGVILGSIFSAGTALLEHLVPHGLRGDLLSWMAGRLPEIPNTAQLITLVCVTLVGFFVLARSAPALDVSMLSDDEAHSSGVDLRRLRGTLFWTGGVLAGIAVAYAGPISFIGLVGPHLARRLLGPHHAALVPGAALAGAVLLVAADAVRQMIDLGSGRLPVGVLTALAGGPAFLWLLRRGFQQGGHDRGVVR